MALDSFLSLSLQQRATRLVGPATHGAMAGRAMAAPCVQAMVAAVATLATLAWLVPAQAQPQGASPAAVAAGYPSRPLRLVVPHAAGGNSDAFGRILGARLAERLGGGEIDRLEAVERLQIHAAVAAREIATLDEREAEIPGEVGVLEVRLVERARREQHDARLAREWRRQVRF